MHGTWVQSRSVFRAGTASANSLGRAVGDGRELDRFCMVQIYLIGRIAGNKQVLMNCSTVDGNYCAVTAFLFRRMGWCTGMFLTAIQHTCTACIVLNQAPIARMISVSPRLCPSESLQVRCATQLCATLDQRVGFLKKSMTRSLATTPEV
ncbi:hypothetical protein BJX61DRAFT_148823 [Aspergillus egyptiacus]|nr:hypothetical protein BJX61DRAFT_148823 [Aspergillus egyptiacus]